ncbi:hypothetical protein DPMN_185507 [Dreissena polymorpha]|uniref:Uncharacterized protein n=1 Tax=Dreissena polymorpha TaxID=45954 RepID=A0A9D4DMX9_DREPO|nr:hypothetical protein DPMN_185507 [Dreissena polymorpha]
MVLSKSDIMRQSQFKRLTVICTPCDKKCISCAKPESFTSTHMFIELSRLLNLPINVMIPKVNGSNNYDWEMTNTILRTQQTYPERGTLMWKSMALPTKPPTSKRPRDPKHIVPMVENVKTKMKSML